MGILKTLFEGILKDLFKNKSKGLVVGILERSSLLALDTQPAEFLMLSYVADRANLFSTHLAGYWVGSKKILR